MLWDLDVPSSLQAWRLSKNWTVAYECAAQGQDNRCGYGGKEKMFGATPRQVLLYLEFSLIVLTYIKKI